MQGKFLIARPILKDPVFGGKIVFVSRFDGKTGTEGFILNGPVVGRVGYGEIRGDEVPEDKDAMKKMVSDGKIDSAPLFSGGPCHSPAIYMVHGYPEMLEFSKDEFQIGTTLLEDVGEDKTIMPGVFYGTPNTMARIVMENKVDEAKFRFFNGITAWSPGQLEREIEAGAWDVVDSNLDVIFNAEEADKLVARLHNRPAKDFLKDIMPRQSDEDDEVPFRIPKPSLN